MKRLNASIVSLISRADRVTWQIVRNRHQIEKNLHEENITSLTAGGTSYMDAPNGYYYTTLFNTIVTFRTPVGRADQHIVKTQKFHTSSHTSRDYHPERQEYIKGWPVSMQHQLVDNPCVIAKATKISDFYIFNLPTIGDGLAINFKNYSGFADRMYLSEYTRNEQINKQVRRFNGNT